MRISQKFGLGLTQPSLDLIDVDIAADTPLFIDPWALRNLPTTWRQQCVELLQDFFGTILGHVAGGRNFDDKLAFIQRCRDTADDQRGFIIPLDDTDLRALVEEAKRGNVAVGLLRERFNRLIL